MNSAEVRTAADAVFRAALRGEPGFAPVTEAVACKRIGAAELALASACAGVLLRTLTVCLHRGCQNHLSTKESHAS